MNKILQWFFDKFNKRAPDQNNQINIEDSIRIDDSTTSINTKLINLERLIYMNADSLARIEQRILNYHEYLRINEMSAGINTHRRSTSAEQQQYISNIANQQLAQQMATISSHIYDDNNVGIMAGVAISPPSPFIIPEDKEEHINVRTEANLITDRLLDNNI